MHAFMMKLEKVKNVNINGQFLMNGQVKPSDHRILGFMVIRINGKKVRHDLHGQGTTYTVHQFDDLDIAFKHTDPDIIRTCNGQVTPDLEVLVFTSDEVGNSVVEGPSLREVREHELNELLKITSLTFSPRSLSLDSSATEMTFPSEFSLSNEVTRRFPMVMLSGIGKNGKGKMKPMSCDVYLTGGNLLLLREHPIFTTPLAGEGVEVKTEDAGWIRRLISELQYGNQRNAGTSIAWFVSYLPFIQALGGMKPENITLLSAGVDGTWWYSKTDNRRIKVSIPFSISKTMTDIAGFKVRVDPLTDKEIAKLSFPDDPSAVSRVFTLL